MKKILLIAGKTVLGVYVFYLFTCCIAIPLLVPPIVKSQAQKILRHPVTIRAVLVNPFLCRVNVYGLRILDQDTRVIAGFDRFSIDISFLKLFTKEYRVESLELDGLQVNAVMYGQGKINLLELVPAPAEQPKNQAMQAQAPAVSATPAKAAPVSAASAPAAKPAAPLPLVTVKNISLTNGTVRFMDKTVTPEFVTTLSGLTLRMTGLTTKPGTLAKAEFQTLLDDKGIIRVDAMIDPFSQPPRIETDFALSSYILKAVSPYTGKYTGHTVKDGKLDIKMVYRIEENKLTASHKLLIQGFGFGEKVESKDALHLPFSLAIALLEDPEGRISISLPVTGDMSSPEFHYWHLVGQVVRNFFMKLVTKPFTFLASMLGSETGSEEMGYARFETGKSVLSDADKAKLDLIVRGLKQRPKLLLEINGSYDPDTDWKAVKKEALGKEFQQLRKNSEWPDSKLYQTMYVPRFGLASYRKLMRGYRTKNGAYETEKLNQEVMRQLEENGSADLAVLQKLAQDRAQAVYDYIAAAGFDKARMRIGQVKQVQGSMGYVPLELTLTVFEVEKSQSLQTP